MSVVGFLLVFLGTNIACAILVHRAQLSSKGAPQSIVFVRVVVNDFLFILFAILLTLNIYRVSRMSLNFHVLESQV